MRTIVAVFVCAFFSDLSCMDRFLTNDTEAFITYAFAAYPNNAPTLRCVSKEWRRIGSDATIIHAAVVLRSKKYSKQEFVAYMPAKYKEEYNRLNTIHLRQDDLKTYLEFLEKNSYADVNYTFDKKTTETMPGPVVDVYEPNPLCKNSSPILYWAICTRNDAWIKPLLEHGADPDLNNKFDDDDDCLCSASSLASELVASEDEEIPGDQELGLKWMDLFFQYGASIDGTTKDWLLGEYLAYSDSIRGLKLLAKHGFTPATHPYFLYNYLENKKVSNLTPSSDTVTYLLELGYNPHKMVEFEDGSANSPYNLALDFELETTHKLFCAFEKCKKYKATIH